MLISWQNHPEVKLLGADRYQLTAPFYGYSERIESAFCIPEGFMFDGDSVPRLPIIYWRFKNRTLVAALIHDYCYTMHELGGVPVTRKEADALFNDAMRTEGLNIIHRFFIHAGVRIGGWKDWRNRR